MFHINCNTTDLKTERSELQTEINELQTDVDRLQEVRDGLIQKDEIIYVIELEISQSHFSLDLEEHMKDYMNTITIPIQVSEEYLKNIIVADLNSSDNTKDIVRKLSKDYDILKVTSWKDCKEIMDNVDEQ